MSLEVNFAGITFKNPVTTASGTFGSGMEYSEFVDLEKLGAVTTKGVANVPWQEIRHLVSLRQKVECSMRLDCKIRELKHLSNEISLFYTRRMQGLL